MATTYDFRAWTIEGRQVKINANPASLDGGRETAQRELAIAERFRAVLIRNEWTGEAFDVEHYSL